MTIQPLVTLLTSVGRAGGRIARSASSRYGGVARIILICQARVQAADRVGSALVRSRPSAHEGSVMQARIATYSFSGDDGHALGRRAEEGILPILKSQPGFKDYSVAIGEGAVLSVSVWDTRADAEAGSEAVASWVAENMAGEIDLISVRYGEVMFSTSLGVSTLAGANA